MGKEKVNKSFKKCPELWDVHRSISCSAQAPASSQVSKSLCRALGSSNVHFPLSLEQGILFQAVPGPCSAPELSAHCLCHLWGLFFPSNTYFSHVVCNWEEQLSDVCARFIRQRGHF